MSKAKQTNTTSTPKVDPVAEIGRQLEGLNFRHDELDRPGANESLTKEIYREAERKAVWDKIRCLRDYATTIPATSLVGALVHIALSSYFFSDLCDNKLNKNEQEATEMRFHRVVYSAVRALSADNVDLDLTEIGVTMHLNEHLDPWYPHERRSRMLATLKALARERGDDSSKGRTETLG